DTEEGEQQAREVARMCLQRRAQCVYMWPVPGLGTEFASMQEWSRKYDLFRTLAIERAAKYAGFVSFVSDPRGERPKFTGAPGPIVGNLAYVPPLQPVMLPEPFRIWCMDIAHRLWCPLEYVATPMVVILSGVIGRRIAIRPKRRDDWKVIPNLW